MSSGKVMSLTHADVLDWARARWEDPRARGYVIAGVKRGDRPGYWTVTWSDGGAKSFSEQEIEQEIDDAEARSSGAWNTFGIPVPGGFRPAVPVTPDDDDDLDEETDPGTLTLTWTPGDPFT